MKLLAIDGNSIINRAFYGIKLLTTKNGQYTNAVYGFINILNKLIDSEHPDGVAVAFDMRSPTFRHKKYSEYKAGRKGMPDELASQLPILKEWLQLAGYTCIECEGYEADDILGTLSEKCRLNGDECVISTGDRDSLQLISDYTRVLLASTKMGRPEIINYDKSTLFEKYGLTPDEMLELKSLMGDSSDNIPGVAGVGEKTATDLITRFHNIDYIYQNIDSIDIKDSVRKKLTTDKENAYLSKELGTICRTAPINTEIKDLKTSARKENELARLMTSLEFFKLMDKMGIKGGEQLPIIDFEKQSTKKYVLCEQNNIKLENTVDIYEENNSFYIISGENVCECNKEYLENILKDTSINKRVYDCKSIYKRFSDVKNIVFDELLGGYLCNPSASSYSSERLSTEYGATVSDIENSDNPAVKNACLFSSTCDIITEQLKKTNQFNLLTDIEIPLAFVLAQMELYGFLVDKKGLSDMSDELGKRIKEIQDKIYALVGYEFNLNSPKQLAVALFEKLQLPAKKKTKSGYSTNADVLEELKNAHPAVSLLLEYRQLSKLKSTYTDGLQLSIADDGRIHSTFNQAETRTGRISSLDPNLQNIPVKTNEGKRLREYFIAENDCVLCDADYSQIELRVLASIANDENMINAFNTGVDIHTLTASEVFNMPIDMVTPIMRSRAKAVNFGIVYGISAHSLSEDIGVTHYEADSYIKNYLSTYPKVAKYMETVIEDAKKTGYVTTLFGRRRYLPELSNSNGRMRAFGERVARNAPIQGTAADIIKIAMIKVYNRLKKEVPDAALILQVHDELIVECKKENAQKVCNILQEEMQNSASIAVKLTADAHYGENWLKAKG